MKKISLIVLAVVTSVAMYAQNYEKPTPMTVTTRFGIKGGVNLSEFKVESAPSGVSINTQNKAGFNGGVFANVPISTMFRFQPELVYSAQGSKMTITQPAFPSGTTTSTFDTRLGYINLPLMLQLQTTNGFFVETGPQVGYLLSAKTVGTGSTTSPEQDVKSQMNKLDFSWGGGIGYLSRIGLGVNARYNFGLRNIYKDQGGSTAQGKAENRVIQAGLFWQFGAGK